MHQDQIPSVLEEAIAAVQHAASYSSDLQINRFICGGISAALLSCDGMISTGIMTELILHPLTAIPAQDSSEALFAHIRQLQLLSLDRPCVRNISDLLQLLYSGFAVLLAEGQPAALAFGVQGYDKRGVSEPSGESNILGAQEGFTETLNTNLSLIRKRMKTPLLKFESIICGKLSRTNICLCWMTDRAAPQLIRQVRKQIASANPEALLAPGYLQPFLEPRKAMIFKPVSQTQRPDILCAKLLEGRCAVLIDGLPYALVVPKLFTESFQTLDDYSFPPTFAFFLRWLKYGAFLLAVLLPAVYIAVCSHHPELLNSTFVLLLQKAEADAPLSLPLEAIGVLLMYEIIREAGLRLPKAVGGAVSLIGGLIIGDAAVSSGFISTPMLTAAAVSVVAGFVTPDLLPQITLLRLTFIAVGGFWGLFGIGLLGMAVLCNLCASQTFGYPMTAPLSPFYWRGMRDTAVRIGFRKMQKNNFTVEEYHEQDA